MTDKPVPRADVRRCFACGRVVIHDEVNKTIAHQLPLCDEFRKLVGDAVPLAIDRIRVVHEEAN